MGLIKGGMQLGAVALAGHYVTKALEKHHEHKSSDGAQGQAQYQQGQSYQGQSYQGPQYYQNPQAYPPNYQNPQSYQGPPPYETRSGHQSWCNGSCGGQCMAGPSLRRSTSFTDRERALDAAPVREKERR